MTARTYLQPALDTIRMLQSHGIRPVLYGSLGAAVYLGQFKSVFSDIDLLVDDIWIDARWDELRAVMQEEGFMLTDEHEHEFSNESGLQVAFAKLSVLTRDGITTSAETIEDKTVGDVTIRTLTPEEFKRAYEFSIKDGYRRDKRGKKDADVIALLNEFIELKR